ncbi:MAG: NAD-dependent epimerase/dehydratase family protein [Thermoanaerobaculaceae bacterium]|nr:NAD-dependent epimerase/dehydratase family protein [Thermoanaerobaculaceae bacterium]
MKVLITGHSGFVGKILYNACKINHYTIGLDRISFQSNILCDLSKDIPQFPVLPDLVIHAAGKAHSIPRTIKDEDEFFKVNYQGTVNLLKGLSALPRLPGQFVFISTVAVYGLEEGEMIDENYPLNGTSAYARSKILAEEAVLQWGKQNNVPVAVLRLPLIAGPDAPGNLGSMIRAINKGYYFRFGSSSARRSMVLASDLARFIPSLHSAKGIYHLTDGVHPSYRELEEYIASHYGKRIRTLPEGILKASAKAGDLFPWLPVNSSRLKKLSYTLTFSDEKARRELGWNPRPVVGNIW